MDDTWDAWDLERRGKLKLGRDGMTPAPDDRRLTINGAPVTVQSHEFVIQTTKKKNAPNQ
jgi:hypothetical protein